MPTIITHMQLWSTQAGVAFVVNGVDVSVSWMWVYVLTNVITQYICVAGVYMLMASAGTLTGSLTMTARKFLSILFSIWFFQNAFSLSHWIGTGLVFSGLLMYTFRDHVTHLLSGKDKRKAD